MTAFLSRLVARHQADKPAVLPRLASFFEPPQPEVPDVNISVSELVRETVSVPPTPGDVSPSPPAIPEPPAPVRPAQPPPITEVSPLQAAPLSKAVPSPVPVRQQTSVSAEIPLEKLPPMRKTDDSEPPTPAPKKRRPTVQTVDQPVPPLPASDEAMSDLPPLRRRPSTTVIEEYPPPPEAAPPLHFTPTIEPRNTPLLAKGPITTEPSPPIPLAPLPPPEHDARSSGPVAHEQAVPPPRVRETPVTPSLSEQRRLPVIPPPPHTIEGATPDSSKAVLLENPKPVPPVQPSEQPRRDLLKPLTAARHEAPPQPLEPRRIPMERPAMPDQAAEAPTIQVTIGRIEVRAAIDPPPEKRSSPRKAQSGLDEYLRRRDGHDGKRQP